MSYDKLDMIEARFNPDAIEEPEPIISKPQAQTLSKITQAAGLGKSVRQTQMELGLPPTGNYSNQLVKEVTKAVKSGVKDSPLDYDITATLDGYRPKEKDPHAGSFVQPPASNNKNKEKNDSNFFNSIFGYEDVHSVYFSTEPLDAFNILGFKWDIYATQSSDILDIGNESKPVTVYKNTYNDNTLETVVGLNASALNHGVDLGLSFSRGELVLTYENDEGTDAVDVGVYYDIPAPNKQLPLLERSWSFLNEIEVGSVVHETRKIDEKDGVNYITNTSEVSLSLPALVLLTAGMSTAD